MAKAARAAQAWRAYREVARPGSPGIGARLRAIPRLLSGVMNGTYPGMGKGRLAMMGLGVLYMLSPVDVIPEFLLLAGVVDDFGVFLWLMTSLLGESGRYVDWERRRIPATLS
ncbi:YkvA family protein [Planobispora siamensis]|uniref:DUF1232 domain-containing protein n=1 Tax=Planobispora siamensis TaxID=936338 RepID=A0A8J3WKT2_9ACTN|nr:YkvA family protein [Planobispora siamensis]GIH93093.1 hypothetical protein Psi01_37230 [Planobispora siamensis]